MFILPGLAQDQNTSSKPRVVAMMGGTSIMEEDLRKAAVGDLDKLNMQL